MRTRVFLEGLNFGEGLRWRDGRFWYSDFYQHRVSSVSLEGEVKVELDLDDQPSGLGWLPDGRLLVVAMKSKRLLRREANGRLVTHADLAPLAKHYPNDMVVSEAGVAYVGCFGFDVDEFIEANGADALFAEAGPPGAPILAVSPSGAVQVAAPDCRFPNGMALSGDYLVAAETFLPGIRRYEVLEGGRLGEPHLVHRWEPDAPFAPDGLCIDAEGAVWVANAIGNEVVRVSPLGEILDRVETTQLAFTCALGGADGRQLMVATATSGSETVSSQVRAGRLELVRVPVRASRS